MKTLTLLFLAICGVTVSLQAQKSKPTTLTYAIKDSDTLWMHHYEPEGESNGSSVMFIHGGGFTGGDPKHQYPFAEGLQDRGYRVFVISYRLYLKGKSFGCHTETPEKIKAIYTAVEDAADAARYIYDHAKELEVNTDKFFIAGSSAGAETVLQFIFNPFVHKDPERFSFFEKFRFAGAMIFAGAHVDLNYITAENWMPLLLFHGTNDQLVPYGTAAHHYCKAYNKGWLMLFGSEPIYQKGLKLNKPVALHAYEGRGHEVANFMFREFETMDNFMKSALDSSKNLLKKVVIPKLQ
ncbi:alpha/beta hydrolase [Rapidithrix thailandica]|uniref:Alpha/beta hydrolase n=1 Tax=Rapidithrix thailandica TaxID=413964 RepID=A0AAW9S983_9BACT